MTELDTKQYAEQTNAIAVPLNEADRVTAHRFAAQQPTTEKAAQVYRNTLAVLTTQRYLERLGVASETTAADSWHPLSRVLEDVADLAVPSLKGKLECRVVKAGDRTCHIPQSVHTDRIGYVIVQLDQPYQTGYLIGFVNTVSVCDLPLSYLQPLTHLIELLLNTSPTPAVAIRQWLSKLFDPDWEPPTDLLSAMGSTLARTATLTRQGKPEEAIRQRLEHLYQLHTGGRMPLLPEGQSDQTALIHLMKTTQNDNIRWQCADLLWEIDPDHPDCPVITAKDLGLYLNGRNLALAVGLLPKTDNTLLILARIYPFADALNARVQTEASTDMEANTEVDTKSHIYLPAGLKLTGLDENDERFFEISARQQDNYIQFKFTAETGDRFTLQTTLGDAEDASFSETFVV
ncbi:MAG: DUF1822 family protein [Cyanobacteria bacterium J06621_11]